MKVCLLKQTWLKPQPVDPRHPVMCSNPKDQSPHQGEGDPSHPMVGLDMNWVQGPRPRNYEHVWQGYSR